MSVYFAFYDTFLNSFKLPFSVFVKAYKFSYLSLKLMLWHLGNKKAVKLTVKQFVIWPYDKN